MSPFLIVALVIALIVILGAVLLPLFNKWQFSRLPLDQQILVLIKQAKKLQFFKRINTKDGGYIFFVKNKRKILVYPFIYGKSNNLVITKKNPFDNWDYPQEKQSLTSDEVKLCRDALIEYSKYSRNRIVWNDPFKQDETENEPNS